MHSIVLVGFIHVVFLASHIMEWPRFRQLGRVMVRRGFIFENITNICKNFRSGS